MTLKVRLYSYVIFLHALVGAVLIWQREALGWWLFACELGLVISLVFGLRGVRIALKPHEIGQTLADIIESGEYGMRYPAVHHREMDRVITAYNRMLENLQREWLRLGEQRGFLERFLSVTPVGIVIFDFDGKISLVNPRARELLGDLSVLGNAGYHRNSQNSGNGGNGSDGGNGGNGSHGGNGGDGSHGASQGDSSDELAGKELADLASPLAQVLATLRIDETRMITDSTGRRLRCQRSRFVDRGFDRCYVLIEELTLELNRSERETYEKLIRMIAHEVTNTVAATNSLLESCRNYSGELADDEHRADFENALDVLITRNRNLNEFTRGYSDLVKLPPPQRHDVDVNDLLNAMRTMFSAELSMRGIELKILADNELPLVSMDRNQMDQVVINVIRNAAEAIDRNGMIEIRAQNGEGRVEVTVTDTGAGLDDAVRGRLFTPFFTTKRQGQGLGLTLVKEILTQHEFGFSLEPADGRTTFRIEMPVGVSPTGRRGRLGIGDTLS